MPRYLLQITEGEFVSDLDAIELTDLAAARSLAADIAAERLRGSGEDFWRAEPWQMKIRDEDGMVIGVLSVTTASAAVDHVTAEPGADVPAPN